MEKSYEVVIIGGGQSGLSMSYLLKQKGISHLVIEKNRIAESWRTQRWDTFCLVTPNWQCNLPGFPYPGNDPKGFMLKDAIVNYIEEYANHFQPPLLEGVKVLEVTKQENGRFLIETSEGSINANQVVIAVGNYHFPVYPEMSKAFKTDIFQLHSSEYKNPDQLPEGAVLVVGTGQSGAQIAEDLHLAGKKVHLCVGNAPRTARIYRGKDVVEWLDEMGYYDLPVDEHPEGPSVRSKTNHYVTGRDGGREIDLRKFALQGMKLYGTLNNVSDDQLFFDANLKKHLDGADRTSENIKRKIDTYIEANKIDAPVDPPYFPVWEPDSEVENIDYENEGITSVIWSIGFGFDFSWIKCPVTDHRGLPVHERGTTSIPGLYFLGLTWQYTWGSARFSGVGKDAGFLLDHIVELSKFKKIAQINP